MNTIQKRQFLLPPEASTFMAKVQVPAKTSIDESLQAAKSLSRVGMAEVKVHRKVQCGNAGLVRKTCRHSDLRWVRTRNDGDAMIQPLSSGMTTH